MNGHAKAYLALVFICIVWGTTYLAIRIGVRHYPAFLFAGMRQFLAGLILIVAALAVSKQRDLSRSNILRQMLTGFLMLTIGNGLVTWGEQYIPSGISALICSLMPLIAVLINLSGGHKTDINIPIVAGMILGLCGVGLIFRQNLAQVVQPAYLAGMLATLIAASGWAMGSILNKKHTNQVNPFLNAGLQLVAGGVFMFIISPFADKYEHIAWWNTEGLLALLYLVVFGSALAYAAYMYSLRWLPVGIATIYAYVNPLIAVVAGAIFLKEELNIYTGLAFLSITLSVFLVNKGYRKASRAETNKEASKLALAFPESPSADS